MISCSIFDQYYEHALCELGASINIMPMVIHEKLLYPALSPTYMCVQLADSTIRYPEGIAKNVLVCVRDSFVLADFVVMDIEGDLGIELILGRPLLRAARARIDVGRREICFRVRKEDIFFRFKHRDEQHFLIHQASEGKHSGVHQNPSQNPDPPHVKERRKQRRCGGRSRVWLRPILQGWPTNGKNVGEKSCTSDSK